MSNLCTIPGCVFFGRYCRLHRVHALPADAKPIAKVSDKRKEVNKEYYREAKAFVKANPQCRLKMKGCTTKSQCVHHRKGKATIELLMNKKFWWASCFHCNTMAEVMDAEARQKDIKLSKFNNATTNS